jgi:hypothetical protein
LPPTPRRPSRTVAPRPRPRDRGRLQSPLGLTRIGGEVSPGSPSSEELARDSSPFPRCEPCTPGASLGSSCGEVVCKGLCAELMSSWVTASRRYRSATARRCCRAARLSPECKDLDATAGDFGCEDRQAFAPGRGTTGANLLARSTASLGRSPATRTQQMSSTSRLRSVERALSHDRGKAPNSSENPSLRSGINRRCSTAPARRA